LEQKLGAFIIFIAEGVKENNAFTFFGNPTGKEDKNND
jgi:hypothetical protein